MSAELPFEGRIALVTGASGGIGAAIARALARGGAGVALAYATQAAPADALAAEISQTGRRAQAFAADMADPRAPGALVAQAQRALAPIDILVACHGRGRLAAYEELAAEDFDLTLAVNLRSPFLLAQSTLAGMRERGWGRVLFISSTAAFRGGVLAPDYAASKSGLHGLAHFLASRVAADGVTVNVIAPGYIDTAMMPGSREELGARVPVGRVGTPEEVAGLACAVLATGYLTNQVMSLDGGIHPRG